ncbi:MAG TPA: hypothetical protein VFV15_03495 [Moraxellaceae bacterium]|nr:hypothetical protein [Moraxellaceae bacterium]
MTRPLFALALLPLLAACSRTPEVAEGTVPGPFPKSVTGTIGSSYPVGEDGGPIKLSLLEFDKTAIIVSAATYEAKGMQEDDAEITLTVEPLPAEQCGDAAQCLRGY